MESIFEHLYLAKTKKIVLTLNHVQSERKPVLFFVAWNGRKFF